MKEYFEKQKEIIFSKKDIIKTTVIATVIFFIFAHIYLLVNDIRNHDSLLFRGYGAGITSGRWALQFIGEFIGKAWGDYNIPFFNNLVSMIFIIGICILIILIFDIKKSVNAILISGIFVVFPSLTSTLIYTFTSHYYIFAIILVFLAAYIIDESNFSFVISTILVSIAIGIYQAYLAFYISVLLFKSVNECVLEKDYKDILKRGIKYIFSLVLSLALYYIILQISLKVTGLSLSNYRNIDSIGHMGFTEIFNRSIIAYKDIIKLPFNIIFSINRTFIIRFSLLVIYLASTIFVFFTIKKIKDIRTKILFLLLLFIIPIAVNSSVIMASKEFTYSLMSYTIVFVFILPLLLIDKLNFNVKLLNISKMLTYSVLTFSIINYIWLSNGNYLSLKNKMNYSENYLNRLITRIESTEGYNDGNMVALIGGFPDKTENHMWRDPKVPFNYDINTITFLKENIRLQFLKNVVGKKIYIVSDDQTKKIAKLKEVKSMSSYPSYGSIKKIDNIIVVKLHPIEKVIMDDIVKE